MGVFQIIFIVVNLGVPIWFWSKTSNQAPSAEWEVWNRNIIRLIDSDGGFPGCTTLNVAGILRDLCETSQSKFKNDHSVVTERASVQVMFTCEFKKTAISTSWRLEDNKNAELSCLDPGGDIVSLAPGFTFALSGLMRSMEFTAKDETRQSIPVRNCRTKAQAAKNMKPPPTLDEFFAQLGRMPGDPPDFLTANFMCFVFDLSPLWRPWRERYPR